MSGWQNPQPNGAFGDPMNSIYNAGAFNTQYSNNQFLGLQNGNSNSPTPGFQVNSVIPAKRPAPQDGGMSGSPRMGGPRSQTPYGGGGQPQYGAPTPYQHLQQPGSGNATPSPTMSNGQYRQPAPQPQMPNASPSPFPQPQQQYRQPSQQPTLQPGQGFNMPSGMSPAGIPSSMPGQQNMTPQVVQQQANLQRVYQMRLQEHQAKIRANGMQGPRPIGGQAHSMYGMGGQQQPGQMMGNGQMDPQMPQQSATDQQRAAQQQKQAQFLKALAGNAAQNGRTFNPNPTINGRFVSLYNLWSLTTQMGGFQNVERNNGWQAIANRLGFAQSHFPNAGEEMKRLHAENMGQYEKAWFAMKQQQKVEMARQHAHQMAGVGGPPPQASPTKVMQPPGQPNQASQIANMYAHLHQQQAQATSQPMNPQATPAQANASIPPQNGMSTPQSIMGGPNSLHQRRSSSMRKAEAVTPQAGGTTITAPSPALSSKGIPATPGKSPSVKQENGPKPLLSEENQDKNYMPNARDIESEGGYDVVHIFDLGTAIERHIPNIPKLEEMGMVDVRAITLSLASGIYGEVRYALDTLATLSHDQRIAFDLDKCEELVDAIVDCAEEQIDLLSEEAFEVSDALDLPSYEDVLRGSRVESESLQEVPEFGTPEYDFDRAADKIIAITTVLRNFSFYEQNHRLLTSSPLIKWLSNTIRLLGTRNMLLRTFFNTQDFYKDVITYLSNITQSLELPSKDDALHILHFLLAFTPQPAPTFTSGEPLRFTPFIPAVHRYLPPAVDCLAKLLARQDPNRMLYRSIFTSSSQLASAESPLDLLTRAFALSIAVLPDRSKGHLGNATELRIAEARKAYLTQGMLAADILSSLAPGNDTELAKAWIESEDGWAVGLLKLASLLSIERPPPAGQPNKRELSMDTEGFKLITHRALGMLRRLAEKAGKGESLVNGAVDGEAADGILSLAKWDGMPQTDSILGALLTPNIDKVALRLLCGLHGMVTQ